MKPAEKVVSILIAVETLAACIPIYKPDIPEPYHETYFHMEATTTENIKDLSDEFHLECSEISKCNLTESILIVLDSKMEIFNEHNFWVKEGNLDLSIPNSGCSLVGTFVGEGFMYDDNFAIIAIVDIHHRTGTFNSSRRGELSLKVFGVEISDNQMKYSIVIDGYL